MSEERNGRFDVKDNLTVLLKGIENVGSQAELARRLEDVTGVRCDPQKINEWRKRKVIPPYWVKPFSAVTGIPKEKIDPLLYGA